MAGETLVLGERHRASSSSRQFLDRGSGRCDVLRMRSILLLLAVLFLQGGEELPAQYWSSFSIKWRRRIPFSRFAPKQGVFGTKREQVSSISKQHCYHWPPACLGQILFDWRHPGPTDCFDPLRLCHHIFEWYRFFSWSGATLPESGCDMAGAGGRGTSGVSQLSDINVHV